MADPQPSHCSTCDSWCGSTLMFIGRLLLAVIFVLAGVGKFLNYEGTAAFMESKGMSMIPLFLYTAALIEISGGILLIIGWKVRWASLLLVLQLIPVTLIFHNFWALGPEMAELQISLFVKNLAIIGGLLYIAATGAGSFSIDRLCCGKKNHSSEV